MRTLFRSSAAALVAALVLAAAPAHGYFGGDGSGGGDDSATGETPTSSTGDSSGSGGGEGMVNNCHVVANSSYLGLTCSNGDGDGEGNRRTIRTILDGDEVPGCWHEPMTEQERADFMVENGEDTAWHWEYCLTGIDPETLRLEPGGVEVSVGYGPYSPDQVVTLTVNQQELVDLFWRDPDRQFIPAPVAGVSPAPRPRVGAWVSFFNGTRSEVTANAGSMVLRASVTRIDVEPLGPGKAPTLTCSGNGYKAQKGDTPDTVSTDACWHKYEQSSAGEPDQKYPVQMTTHWAVEYSLGGGGWQAFAPQGSPVTFTKSQVTHHPVTEIQALVIR